MFESFTADEGPISASEMMVALSKENPHRLEDMMFQGTLDAESRRYAANANMLLVAWTRDPALAREQINELDRREQAIVWALNLSTFMDFRDVNQGAMLGEPGHQIIGPGRRLPEEWTLCLDPELAGDVFAIFEIED